MEIWEKKVPCGKSGGYSDKSKLGMFEHQQKRLVWSLMEKGECVRERAQRERLAGAGSCRALGTW